MVDFAIEHPLIDFVVTIQIWMTKLDRKSWLNNNFTALQVKTFLQLVLIEKIERWHKNMKWNDSQLNVEL